MVCGIFSFLKVFKSIEIKKIKKIVVIVKEKLNFSLLLKVSSLKISNIIIIEIEIGIFESVTQVWKAKNMQLQIMQNIAP